jgi:hypothetical protein
MWPTSRAAEVLELAKSQPTSRAASEDGSIIEAKVQELERRLEKGLHHHTAAYDHSTTALFGGLDKHEDEASAKHWLAGTFVDLKIITPLDIFPKGDFKGMLFAKFESTEARDNAVTKFWKARIIYGGQLTWSKEDLPIERRVPETFLFALKKQFLEWKYEKFEVRVDKMKQTLAVDGTVVVRAWVNDKKFGLTWDPEWEAWAELKGCPELSTLQTKATDAIGRSASSNKGKGKKGRKGHGVDLLSMNDPWQNGKSKGDSR